MASALFMYGLPQPLIIAEDPDVASDIVDAARDAGESAFCLLHSQGSYLDVSNIGKEKLFKMLPAEVVGAAEQKFSFTDMKVRHEAVLAIRGVHPGEVPE